MIIEDRIAAQIPAWRERVSRLVHDYGNNKVCDITVEQIFGGMRGVHVQVSDISYLEPYKGILYRGYSIQEVISQLPRAAGSEYPLAGGLYYLLMTSEIPTQEQADEVEAEWRLRSPVPGYVLDMLDTLPAKTHPMTMFSQAILALQNESLFSSAYGD
ncbi:MAG TPA: citrate/2-methylcitrate synthase, partial [Anaerolineaceae bacterium]